jgi:hypothetical protein
MQDSRTTATMAVTALMLALAAMLAGPAQARHVEGTSGGGGAAAQAIQDRNLTVTDSAQPSVVVPYLSQGIGVDKSAFETTPVESAPVVPYLSHGVGVDSSLFRDTQQNARHNSGWYTGLESGDLPTTPFGSTSTVDDSFDWGPVSFGAGAAVIALLLAMMTLIALRRPNRLAHR